MGRLGLTLRRLDECIGPEHGGQPSGKPCAVGGLEGHGEAREETPRSSRQVLGTSLRAGQAGLGRRNPTVLGEFPLLLLARVCGAELGSPPALPTRRAQKKTCVWATSPFSCREQNSDHMAQAACTWHLANLEHWLCAFENVSKPCFQTMLLRAGCREHSALLPEFPDATLAGRSPAAWAEREPSRPSF